jgi:hypothetical protein
VRQLHGQEDPHRHQAAFTSQGLGL